MPNGSLFYWFITLLSDCRHLNKREVEAFPIPRATLLRAQAEALGQAVTALMRELRDKSETRVMKFKHDTLTVECVLPRRSWQAVQAVDQLIAAAVALDEDEADYIAGYDIKYRLGQGADVDD